MRYLISTYGCQRNNHDSERIAAVLENQGYQATSNLNEADLIVVNACSVRQPAIDRIFGQIQKFAKLKAQNPKFKTILTGCVLPSDKKKFAGVFDSILDIKELIKNTQIKPKYQSSFKAYLPIMTGCNNSCTYCVVPYTRGKEISMPIEEIICQVKNLVKDGYKEIWLLGENVNSYQFNFPELLRKINDIAGNFWIRFTSPHPKDFSDELIKVMAECQKVTEYINLPVQSGDNEILKKMNRPYQVQYYKNLVKKIRKMVPEVFLSTDAIVGFPGETKKQFQNTVKLFKEIKYDMAYISKYSPRPGTIAAQMPDDISHQEKKKREKILTEVLKQTALENNKKYIGGIVEVLPEKSKNGFLIGKTWAYKTIKFKGPKNLIGQFIEVKITDALPWGLNGELAN